MTSLLTYGVSFSFLFCIASLSFLVLKTFSFGKRPQYAESRGSAAEGIVYAFGRGMMPWEKESAGKHLPTYFSGIAYHGGVFGALLYLLLLVVSLELPQALLFLFRLLLILGLLGGLALFFKRVSLSAKRKLSCPDDFAANAIVSLFLLLAVIHTYVEHALRPFLLTAIVMFLYVPFGKIRHCFFFFYARVLLGLFYGSRGVLPPREMSSR